jgi:hypothetical protein
MTARGAWLGKTAAIGHAILKENEKKSIKIFHFLS